jgi:hypothetical protein
MRKRPGPVLVKEPVPAMTPERLRREVEEGRSRVPPEAPRVMPRKVLVEPDESRSVPPLRTRLAGALPEAPRGLGWPPSAREATETTPPLMTVGPV